MSLSSPWAAIALWVASWPVTAVMARRRQRSVASAVLAAILVGWLAPVWYAICPAVTTHEGVPGRWFRPPP
jgi:predicted PurR-regulated permease PerM